MRNLFHKQGPCEVIRDPYAPTPEPEAMTPGEQLLREIVKALKLPEFLHWLNGKLS